MELGVTVLAMLSLSRIPPHKILAEALAKAVELAGARVLETSTVTFGVEEAYTITMILSSSHLSASTWAEHSVLLLDIFSCGVPSTLIFWFFLLQLKRLGIRYRIMEYSEIPRGIGLEHNPEKYWGEKALTHT